MKRQLVTTTVDLDRLEAVVTAAAQATVQDLGRYLTSNVSPLTILGRLKFAESGRDPLDIARPLNLVEQLNQTFTYLASIAGARWLLEHHPECAPLVLNLGTMPGSDIESKVLRALRSDDSDQFATELMRPRPSLFDGVFADGRGLRS